MISSLLQPLGGARSLAMIGMGKNVGKTTALNALVEEAQRHDLPLALTSIGRDGELVDAISSHPKPPIRVPVGTLVATVEGALPEVEGAFDVLEQTGLRTALGPIVIAQALRAAQWELSGPALGSGLLQLRQRFYQLGARLVIFDGAFDRRSSATPSLTEATLLVSGAALDPDQEVVLAETAHRVRLFTLPEEPSLLAEARQLLDQSGLGWQGQGQVQSLPYRSALGREEEVAQKLPPEAELVLVGSALTPRLLEALAGRRVVVQDGTHALVTAAEVKRFQVRGGSLAVHRPIHLPYLVANPYSPYGWRFDPQEFQQRLAEAVAPLPVVDVVRQCEVACSAV